MRTLAIALGSALFTLLLISVWASDAGSVCEVSMLQGTAQGC
jgi:hypothetical protein